MSAKATAIFEADDKQLSNALLNINRKLLAFQQTVAKVVGGFVGIQKAAQAAEWGFNQFSSALEKGSELVNLSANTGIAVADLMVLQRQFEMAGKGAEDVGPVMAKMMKNIETGSAAAMIKRLGLNMQDLRRMTPADQFQAIGQAINALPDPAERATAAMDIFGKTGASLLAVFSASGFGDAAAQIGEQASILGRDAALFKDVSEKLHLAGLKIQGFFVGVADRVVPMLKPLLDKFAGMDFSGMGQQFGDAVAILFQAFQNGNLGKLVQAALEYGFAVAINYLAELWGKLMAGMNLMPQWIQDMVDAFTAITMPEFWASIGASLSKAAGDFIAIILDGIAKMLEAMRNIPGIGKGLAKGAQGLREKAKDIRERGQLDDEYSASDLADAWERNKQKEKQESSNHKPLIDLTDLKKTLDDATAKSQAGVKNAQDAALKAVPTKTPDAPTGEDFMVKPAFSHLQRIGGGGVGGGADPLLSENRKQTNELSKLNGKMDKLIQQKPSGVPALVFT